MNVAHLKMQKEKKVVPRDPLLKGEKKVAFTRVSIESVIILVT